MHQRGRARLGGDHHSHRRGRPREFEDAERHGNRRHSAAVSRHQSSREQTPQVPLPQQTQPATDSIQFIQPGKPIQSCSVESSNGKLREECVNEFWFPGSDDDDLGHSELTKRGSQGSPT